MTFESIDEATVDIDGTDFDVAADEVAEADAREVVESQTVEFDEVEEILVLDEVPDPQATLPVWEPTGNAAVDAALEELHAVAQTDLGEHAEIYERVQQSLRATLDGLAADDDPA